MKIEHLAKEFLLVAACCRWPHSAERTDAVRNAAGEVRDWNRVLAITRRQRVEGLVHDGLGQASIEPPEPVAAALADAASEIARENLAHTAESLRLRRLFDGAGIGFLFLKGVPLGLLAYGNLGVKKAWDIDLLVAEDDVEQACALLGQAGYGRIKPGPEVSDSRFRTWVRINKESLWRSAAGLVVELHSGLVDNPSLLPSVTASSPAEEVEVAPGKTLPTLQRDALFAYLCVHGATHAWSRLKWIADVAALVRAGRGPDSEEAEAERLYRTSLDLGVGRCSAQALLLCEKLLATRLSLPLKRELESDYKTRMLVDMAVGAMAGPHAEVELDETVLGTVPIHLSHFMLGRGWRYKWQELRRKSVSPDDRMRLPLPRPLHFLYPLIAVPSWLLRRATGRPGG